MHSFDFPNPKNHAFFYFEEIPIYYDEYQDDEPDDPLDFLVHEIFDYKFSIRKYEQKLFLDDSMVNGKLVEYFDWAREKYQEIVDSKQYSYALHAAELLFDYIPSSFWLKEIDKYK